MICANFSNPSMALVEAAEGDSAQPLSRSRHSCASCIELDIDDHIDSNIDVPSVTRAFGRRLMDRLVTSMELSLASGASYGMLTVTAPMWPQITSIPQPCPSQRSFNACNGSRTKKNVNWIRRINESHHSHDNWRVKSVRQFRWGSLVHVENQLSNATIKRLKKLPLLR